MADQDVQRQIDTWLRQLRDSLADRLPAQQQRNIERTQAQEQQMQPERSISR